MRSTPAPLLLFFGKKRTNTRPSWMPCGPENGGMSVRASLIRRLALPLHHPLLLLSLRTTHQHSHRHNSHTHNSLSLSRPKSPFLISHWLVRNSSPPWSAPHNNNSYDAKPPFFAPPFLDFTLLLCCICITSHDPVSLHLSLLALS